MDKKQEIMEKVVDGLVLDEHGKWIPIANKIKSEQEFLARLEAGEVLYEGEWIPISEIKKRNDESLDNNERPEPEDDPFQDTITAAKVMAQLINKEVNYTSSELNESEDFPAETVSLDQDFLPETVAIDIIPDTDVSPKDQVSTPNETVADADVDRITLDSPDIQDAIKNINAMISEKKQSTSSDTEDTYNDIDFSDEEFPPKKNGNWVLFFILIVIGVGAAAGIIIILNTT